MSRDRYSTIGYHYIRYAMFGIYMFFIGRSIDWLLSSNAPLLLLSIIGVFLTTLTLTADIRNQIIWRENEDDPGPPVVTYPLYAFYGAFLIWFICLHPWIYSDWMSPLYPDSAAQIRSSELRHAAVREEERKLSALELRVKEFQEQVHQEEKALQKEKQSLKKEKDSLQKAKEGADGRLEAAEANLGRLEKSRRQLEAKLKREQDELAQKKAKLQKEFEREKTLFAQKNDEFMKKLEGEQAQLVQKGDELKAELERENAKLTKRLRALDRSAQDLKSRELELADGLKKIASEELAYETEKEALDKKRTGLEEVRSGLIKLSSRKAELANEELALLRKSEDLGGRRSSLAVRADKLAKQEVEMKEKEVRYRQALGALLSKESDLKRRLWTLGLNRGAALGIILIAITVTYFAGSHVIRKIFVELI